MNENSLLNCCSNSRGQTYSLAKLSIFQYLSDLFLIKAVVAEEFSVYQKYCFKFQVWLYFSSFAYFLMDKSDLSTPCNPPFCLNRMI